MDETKFKEDWVVHLRVESLAIKLLSKGLSPKEVQAMVIISDEYSEWISIDRCFETKYQKNFYYTDLLGSIEFKRYEHKLKQLAKIEMGILDDKTEFIWEFEYDRLFSQIGLKIRPAELGSEMGKFSQLINLNEPLGLLEFLSLITDNASSLLHLEENTLITLKNQKNEIDSFIEKFKASFG
ncbi:hypothetical protein GK047_25215 [Paenibacillus sp. SYP-B3998]|uniref:Uncharacterized protein n=1 Tax=Paenibacillus sp. SYP-B3998 TaxID=2678564 RepID=A0A6G4A433_9BACL|nr:hypothetical protein [Paenibacillus sp. SYP-B3998]NEW09266.1 hypothetical protein [Paenibacillus sp. SYP-B3998]